RGPARIVAHSVAHEPLPVPDPVPWGSQGLVLQLQKGAPLAVRVRDGAGAPVTAFTVRLSPLGVNVSNSQHGRARASGTFADGVASIASVPIGKWLVLVELPEGAPFARAAAPIDILDHAARTVDVRAAEATRQVRVVDRTGRPMAGSR